MSYDEFIRKVTLYFTDYFASGAEIKIRKFQKNNGVTHDGLVILKDGINIAPTIYLDLFYENMDEDNDFDSVCREILLQYERHAFSESIEVDFFKDYENIRNSLGLKLIHYEMNRDFLEEVPYIRVLDLAICFYYFMPSFGDGEASILIRKEHLDYWNVSVDTLYTDAKKSAERTMPYRLRPIEDVILEMLDMQTEGIPLYILTNGRGNYGASAMLYDKVLADFAEKMKDDLYVIPCSVHEVMIFPKNAIPDMGNVNELIREVNEMSLCKEEILSDHAYEYILATHELLCVA